MESPVLLSQNNGPFIPIIKKILEDFASVLANTTERDNVLEIGCGAGDVAKNLLVPYFKTYKYIVGADISGESIQFARDHYHHKGLVYEVLDIEGEISHFKEKWNSFSRIVSFSCMQWINDWDKALSNIRELLSDDGECLLYFITGGCVRNMWLVKSRMEKWSQYMTDIDCILKSMHDSWKSSTECPRLMKENGLDLLNLEELDHEAWFDDVGTLQGFLRSIDPFISRIPEQFKTLYMEESIDILRSFPGFERNVSGNTKYVISSKRALIWARKKNVENVSLD